MHHRDFYGDERRFELVRQGFYLRDARSGCGKVPFRILQATVGAVVGMILCWPCVLHKVYTAKILKNR